jgi:hypothetical protein
MKPKPFVLASAFVLCSSLSALAQEAQPPAAVQPAQQQAPTVNEPKPSSGTGLVIAGAVVGGVGVVNLATSPLCKVDDLIRDKDWQDTCLAAALIFGGVLVSVGVPLLIVGLNKRSTYLEWKERHPVAAGFGLAPAPSGAALTYQYSF